MPLALVIHDLPAGSAAARAMVDAIYEIAAEHWPLTNGALLAVTGVSPGYLRAHLLRAVAALGGPAGLLLVTRLDPDAAWSGLPAAGAGWVQASLE